jgi:pimeloyl-ACP methyl ester carboxylesterase
MENLEVEGVRIVYRRFRPATDPHPASRGAVLFIHGWTGAQDANDVRLARLLAADGFHCLTFDLAGHGRSAGRAGDFTVAQFLRQAAAACDALGDPLPFVCGSSFGAYLALLLSRERPLRGLSLRVPANYPDAIFAGPPVASYIASGQARPFREQPLTAADNRALAALAGFEGPVQLIAAGRDETIPCRTTENFISAIRPGALQYHVLAEATHTLYAIPAMRREAWRLVREWLAARTSQEGSTR